MDYNKIEKFVNAYIEDYWEEKLHDDLEELEKDLSEDELSIAWDSIDIRLQNRWDRYD